MKKCIKKTFGKTGARSNAAIFMNSGWVKEFPASGNKLCHSKELSRKELSDINGGFSPYGYYDPATGTVYSGPIIISSPNHNNGVPTCSSSGYGSGTCSGTSCGYGSGSNYGTPCSSHSSSNASGTCSNIAAVSGFHYGVGSTPNVTSYPDNFASPKPEQLVIEDPFCCRYTVPEGF